MKKLATIAARIFSTRLGSACAAAGLTAVLTVAATFLGANVFGEYGFALFLGVPFCLGLFATLIYGYSAPRDLDESIAVAMLAVAVGSLALVAVALEGVICIVMALPLTLGLGVVGAAMGFRLQRHGQPRPQPKVIGAVIMLAPALLGADSVERPEPRLNAVTTSVVVDAPPRVVWRNIVAVEPLPPPHELMFRLGIAYPTQATISGRGVGAIRRCTFTTGDFVEPITVWEPGRRLEFTVRSQPPAMQELSPHGHVHAPHLDGFLVSERGGFELVPLDGSRTLLRGTTWYRNKMLPERYWRVWSDAMIHRIHARVLSHVAALAEREAPGAAGTRS